MKKKIFMLTAVLAFATIFSGCSSNEPKELKDDNEAVNIYDGVTLPETIVVNPQPLSETSAPDKEEKLFEAAYELYDDASYKEAVKEYENFLKEYPDSELVDDCYLYMGHCYDQLKLYNKAINTLSKVITDYPDTNSVPRACFRIATIYSDRLNSKDSSYIYYAKCIEYANTSFESLNALDSSMYALSDLGVTFDTSAVSFDAENQLQGQLAGIEKNSNAALDAILEIAKEHSSILLKVDEKKAIKYLYDNYPNYYDSSEKMELAMYYGALLDYANFDELRESQIGFKALECVKYVYRKTDTVLSQDTQLHLEKLNKLFDEYLQYNSLK